MPYLISDPDVVFKLHAYKEHGWTFYNGQWFCKDCRPDNIGIDKCRHPHYSNYHDLWDHDNKIRSHFFPKEPYDYYADELIYQMCRCCDYSSIGSEDDGSTWIMCCVERPNDHWGHNLYQGHFFGSAIAGRICPYFTCGSWIGRNPEEDRKNHRFHVPYNECYDGD